MAAQPDNAANAATTFLAKFNAMGDIFNGVYGPFLAEYEANNGVQAEVVLQNTLTQLPVDRCPSVYVYQDPEHTLRIVHHLHRVEREMGQPDNPLTDVVLGFTGEVEFNLAQVVRIPEPFFATTGEVRVPTVAALGDMLAAAPNGMLGPFEPDADDTELVNTRRAIPIPFAYLPLFTFRSLSPSQAWIQVAAQIIEDDRADDCAVLIDFFRVALVIRRGAVRNQPNLPPATAQPAALAAPLDGPLNQHIHRKLTAYLPALFLGQPQQGMPAAQAAVLIGQSVAEGFEALRADRAQEREAQDATKSFSAQYPASGGPIRRLCLVGDDDDLLPEFWKFLASVKTKKVQGLPALNSLLDARINDPTSAGVRPIISAALYSTISSFALATIDYEDITQGVSPFVMCPLGFRKAKTLTRNAQTYMHIQTGMAPTLADLTAIAPSGDFSIPDDIYTLVDFIGAYSVLWDVLVGEENPLAITLRTHHFFWRTEGQQVRSALPTAAMHKTLIIGTLRFIQLEVMRYVHRIMHVDPQEPPPVLQPIVEAVRQRRFHTLPALPSEYNTIPTTTTLPPTAGRTIAPTGTPPAFNNPPTSTPSVAPATDKNQHFISTFLKSGKSIQQLRAITDQPKQRDGIKPLCLSYHFRGRCFDNCRRNDTHRKLDQTETNNMQAFLERHIV